jgi:endonuclease/exonuclease/phosphatase family metal-dependent hydrolase
MANTTTMSEQEQVQEKPAAEQPVKRKRLSIINRFAWLLNYAAVISLLISYLAPFVSPASFWFIAFFGLAYPVLVIVNLLFVFYWLIQLRPRFLVSLIAILAGWTYLQGFMQVNLDSTLPDKSKDRFKLMSYNVRLFDLYNWSHNKETRDRIFDLLKEEAPQVLCLQEFFNSDKGDFQNLDTLLKLQNAKYSHVEYTTTLRDKDHWGIATFSTYPIVDTGSIRFNTRSNNICIYTDIKVNKDTIRVYNVHMQSIHFGHDDYKFLDEVMKKDAQIDEIEGSKNILRRLKRAYVKRAAQADKIAAHIADSPYPVIICGDFNDTPSSYVYRALSNRGYFEDAFVESGNGFGRTYGGKFPSFRIDYIMNDPKFRTYDFRTISEDELSDHYPVCCYFEMWE